MSQARNRAEQLGQAARERIPQLAERIAASITRDYLGGGSPNGSDGAGDGAGPNTGNRQ